MPISISGLTADPWPAPRRRRGRPQQNSTAWKAAFQRGGALRPPSWPRMPFEVRRPSTPEPPLTSWQEAQDTSRVSDRDRDRRTAAAQGRLFPAWSGLAAGACKRQRPPPVPGPSLRRMYASSTNRPAGFLNGALTISGVDDLLGSNRHQRQGGELMVKATMPMPSAAARNSLLPLGRPTPAPVRFLSKHHDDAGAGQHSDDADREKSRFCLLMVFLHAKICAQGKA